ncbi:GH92 family glycosyl hydrolase [Bacteroidota bacterium]
MKFFSYLIVTIISLGCLSCSNNSEDIKNDLEPVDYVNPYMGTISHILMPTFPTVHLPHGMMRVIPHRRESKEVSMAGLPVFLTSHRGSNAFSLSPYSGKSRNPSSVIEYSYDHEKISPYSYSVYLDDYNVQADLAVAKQSAIYEIQYKEDGPAYLVISSSSGSLSWDGSAISGYQDIENGTKAYIYLLPGSEPESVSVLQSGKLMDNTNAEGDQASLVLEFKLEGRALQLKYGVSFIDEAQAQANMKREIGGYSLNELTAYGRDVWNEALRKIDISGGFTQEKRVFYTSLYRCYERPVCISEDGRYYSPFDKTVHEDHGRPFYIDDWIWDSFRAHHPIRTIIDTRIEEDILHSFIEMSEQMDNFWMPTFPRIIGDTRSMNSNHGVATFLDAYRKGLDDFDLEKAFLAGKLAVTEKTLAPWSAMPAGELDEFYHKNGYFPALRESESESAPEVHHFERRQPVAVTLGTAYDEWCLGQMAEELNKMEEAKEFKAGSFNYRNLYNKETGFFHPKDELGNFIQPFDYVFSGGMGARGYYDENNAWTYRWDVQHNIPDLIDLMGGKEAFVRNLDAMFREPLGRSKYAFYAQLPDQTGNVGQFSMANEPSLHIPYLYNYADQPWKTQKCIHKLINDWFRDDLMGIPGDEDGGGMSAFVVFSMMGFYPVTPGDPVYSIGSPFFESSLISLENGKTFKISARNFSQDNKYIQSAMLNGKPIDQPIIQHDDIMKGGILELEMGPYANKNWGISHGEKVAVR